MTASFQPDVDVVVVGAGMAGLYAVHKLTEDGFSVQGFERSADVGGVWFHNRYPGARVDLPSQSYSYYFSEELFREWTWKERYAPQSELIEYFNHVADKFDLRRFFRFECAVTGATWDASRRVYVVSTSSSPELTCRYLVMASGHLSQGRQVEFPGLESFTGEWHQTSAWPTEPVDVAGRRIAVIGTGSSGTQAITSLAKDAEQLTVFQRTANYCVPARNGPPEAEGHRAASADVEGTYRRLLATRQALFMTPPVAKAADLTPQQQLEECEKRWSLGGSNMYIVFADQATNRWAADIVGDFIRGKIRETVKDPDTASKLLPREYPIGGRRLVICDDYYETYNRDNVKLVDVRADPIRQITSTGIQTAREHHEVDLIVFALGFEAFTGALDAADIRNAQGETPGDLWRDGPRTYLGLMSAGFPNLFLISNAGSPSVLANLFVHSVYQINVLSDLLAHMKREGRAVVEPNDTAVARWSEHVDELARGTMRYETPNYMVHFNRDSGSKAFIPYPGGLAQYEQEVNRMVERGYEGFTFE